MLTYKLWNCCVSKNKIEVIRYDRDFNEIERLVVDEDAFTDVEGSPIALLELAYKRRLSILHVKRGVKA